MVIKVCGVRAPDRSKAHSLATWGWGRLGETRRVCVRARLSCGRVEGSRPFNREGSHVKHSA